MIARICKFDQFDCINFTLSNQFYQFHCIKKKSSIDFYSFIFVNSFSLIYFYQYYFIILFNTFYNSYQINMTNFHILQMMNLRKQVVWILRSKRLNPNWYVTYESKKNAPLQHRLAGCQIKPIDVNFHLQKSLEIFDKNSATKNLI